MDKDKPLLLWYHCPHVTLYQELMKFEFKHDKLPKRERWQPNPNKKILPPIRLFTDRDARLLALQIKNSKELYRIEKLLGLIE